MNLEYRSYSRNSLKQKPDACWLGQWRVDYLAFSRPENAEKPPLLVIGGAFQNFNSYKFCVEEVLKDFPVVLIDLPSLGTNDQPAPELVLEDMVDLLYGFVSEVGWPQVHLMGLSLGSVLAATFAYKFPKLSGKMIVAGILSRPRKSWRMLLEESRRVLRQGRTEEFSQAVVLYLSNYERLEETGLTSTARRLFVRQMKQMNPNEQERYLLNSERMSSVEGVLGYPDCETLVATGEYDSFTLPWENAEFASRCPNSTFVLIENADHLPQLERREVSLQLFSTFLKGESLDSVEGIRVLQRGAYENMDRRRSVRVVPVNPAASVISESRISSQTSNRKPAVLVDINFFGCLLKLEDSSFLLADHARDLTLKLETPDFSIGLLPFEYPQDGYLRCIFKHGNIKEAERLSELLKDTSYFVNPASIKAPSVGQVAKMAGK